MDILHRDDHFVAVDKPAGLASVRERWTDDESALVALWQILKAEAPDAPKPRVVPKAKPSAEVTSESASPSGGFGAGIAPAVMSVIGVAPYLFLMRGSRSG